MCPEHLDLLRHISEKGLPSLHQLGTLGLGSESTVERLLAPLLGDH